MIEGARKLTDTRELPLARAAWPTALIVVLLGGVALLPRVLGLADFLTTDEVYNWMGRVERFSEAITGHQWGATVLVGHPGITLTWLASVGLAVERFASAHGWVDVNTQVEYLRWMRLPAALFESLSIPCGYLLLRRLVAPATALIAALLWATSPYLIAHSRLLHLDALLTTFVTFSVLCVLIGCQAERRYRWIVAAGVFAGLALLTKGPALIALPFVGLLMFAAMPEGREQRTKNQEPENQRTEEPKNRRTEERAPAGSTEESENRRLTTDDKRAPNSQLPTPNSHRIVAGFFRRLRVSVPLYVLWLAVAALVFTLVWPAMWVDPGHALRAFFGLILQNGGRPNGDGQFFLGRAIGDPGPLFYLVSDLFRMTPVMLVGLIGLPLALLRPQEQRTENREQKTKNQESRTENQELRTEKQEPQNRRTAEPRAAQGLEVRNFQFSIFNFSFGRSEERRTLLALAAFALFWTLVMTVGLKKFDRYTLPTWPALLVLSAAGWRFWLWDAGAWLGARWARVTPRVWAGVRGVVLAGALALELLTLAQYQPYYLSYYNPLLGGGAAAQRALLIGWGEGMDQAGAYLSSQPDILSGPVISALPRTLRPFVPVPVNDVIDPRDTPVNYAVVYLESIQRGANPAIYAAIRQTVPLHTITIHGIDYAQIYQLPRPFERAIDAHFGDGLVLRGVTIKRAAGQLIVTPAWDVRGRLPTDYQAFVHVIDATGRTIAQIDVAPGGGTAATSAWEPGQQIAVPLPLGLPDGLPKGMYQVTLGLYDPQNGQRLPISGGTPADAATAGPNALLLDTIALP